jgi:excisionase family DNA binding protein
MRRAGVLARVAAGSLRLPSAAELMEVSYRYLVNSVRPLPHYRVGGRVLVRKSDFDTWAGQFRVALKPKSIDSMVDDVLGTLR